VAYLQGELLIESPAIRRIKILNIDQNFSLRRTLIVSLGTTSDLLNVLLLLALQNLVLLYVIILSNNEKTVASFFYLILDPKKYSVHPKKFF
jgi:ABC-type enterochelin transport system permease subunit